MAAPAACILFIMIALFMLFSDLVISLFQAEGHELHSAFH